jgi:hypothetical protein
MKMKKNTGEFYLEIEDSVELRRQMLETSKGLIGILQRYEDMKAIDSQKVDEIEHFKSTLKEIGSDITRLKSMMPKVKLSELPKKETPLREIKIRVPKQAPAPVVKEADEPAKEPELSPGKMLENQLNEIEQRLKDLQ